MTLYEDAVAACEQLDPGIVRTAKAFVNACWGKNFQFSVDRPVRRTAEQQHAIWQRGRDKNGKVIGTIYTHQDGYKSKSQHQDGLAMDLYPLNCTYEQIAQVAMAYGIMHPFTKANKVKNKGFVDEPHFDFSLVPREPPPFAAPTAPEAARRKMERKAKNEKDPEVRKRILDRLSRS